MKIIRKFVHDTKKISKYELDLNTAIHSKVRKIAKKLKDKKISFELISKVTELPIKEIEKL